MIYFVSRICLVLCGSVALLGLIGFAGTPSAAMASAAVGSIKGTVSATTSDVGARPTLLAGARLTLVNRDLPGRPPLKFLTNETGNFIFSDLPAANYLL